MSLPPGPIFRAVAALSLALVPVSSARTSAKDPAQDPTQLEVPLPASGGWRASLVIDNGKTGIWTVKAFHLFPQHACPEIVGLDDLGHCWILVSYSGKWTPFPTIEEKKWLGGLAHGDVDPRTQGDELYTGGQLGNLYQVLTYPFGATDHRLIARFEGREIHTVLAGDLDPRSPGSELLVFVSPGALYRVAPTGPDGKFETEHVQELVGRVRDALVLPSDAGAAKEIATVSRAGAVELLRIASDGPHWSTIHAAPMGKGRIALAPQRPGAPTVLYTTQDDGLILRHERKGRDEWASEAIYLGPQGTRGIAAGRFDADPAVETVAVFGYSKKVELLSRKAGGAWSVETIFEDRDKGHWLAAAELDGRNATDELIGAGYGGRIFQLARPPGTGMSGVLATSAVELAATSEARAVPRVAVRASPERAASIDPLSYGGGFEPKTLVHETLVVRDEAGRIAPGLAGAWRIEDGGRAFVFQLRPDARFHDGTPVDADAVRLHFRRWVGLPEHGWLGASERIRDVVAIAADELRVVLDRPYALLPDLCAVNPCAIRGPGAVDRNGRYVGPVGGGAFRFVAAREAGKVLRLEREQEARASAVVDLVCFGDKEERAPLEALLRGSVDLVFDGWYENVPRERVQELARDPELDLEDGPGSSVWYLSFRLDGGPTKELDVRRRVQSAVDRAELARRVEHGYADPCRGWASPALAVWPAAAEQARWTGPAPRIALVLAVDRDVRRQIELAGVLAEQLGRAGFALEVRALGAEELAGAVRAGDYDLRIEQTWGAPYDPDISLRARFLPPPARPAAATERDFGVDPTLRRLVEEAGTIAGEAERQASYRLIQARIDDAAVVVPLYAPRRIALVRRGDPLPPLGPDLYRIDLAAWLSTARS